MKTGTINRKDRKDAIEIMTRRMVAVSRSFTVDSNRSQKKLRLMSLVYVVFMLRPLKLEHCQAFPIVQFSWVNV